MDHTVSATFAILTVCQHVVCKFRKLMHESLKLLQKSKTKQIFKISTAFKAVFEKKPDQAVYYRKK